MKLPMETKQKLKKALEDLKKEPQNWYRGDFSSQYNTSKVCILGKVLLNEDIKIWSDNLLPIELDHQQIFSGLNSLGFDNFQIEKIVDINDDSSNLEDLERKLIEANFLPIEE